MATHPLIFASFIFASLLLKVWLANRHISHIARHRSEVPNAFSEKMTIDTHQRAADYTTAGTRLSIAESVVATLLILILTAGGGVSAIDRMLLINFGTGLLQQTALIVVLTMLFSIVDLPFAYFRQFVLEERFGFNKMTRALFWADQLKTTAFSAIIGIPLLISVLALMNFAGAVWWLYVWLVWMAFSLLLLFIYPSFIAPFFNRFEPLSDQSLRKRVESLLLRCGFKAKGIFVMDGSRRSSHGNAYFTGLGANKRIVFFDTLLKQLTASEIEAVLAHELGHFKHKHIVKRLAVSFLFSLIILAALGWLSAQPWVYSAFHAARPAGLASNAAGGSAALALALFGMLAPACLFIFKPIGSVFSRRHEFQADAFAAQHVPATELISALVKLYEDNASTLTPDPLYATFYYSHPPAFERIQHLNAHAN